MLKKIVQVAVLILVLGGIVALRPVCFFSPPRGDSNNQVQVEQVD